MSDTNTNPVVTREEFDALKEQLARIEATLARLAPAPETKPEAKDEPISEETLHIIAAAVAAYLGKRATIRIVRRVQDPHAWSNQGRATVAASKGLPRTRGW